VRIANINLTEYRSQDSFLDGKLSLQAALMLRRWIRIVFQLE
jgi:hypothetical protein